MVAQYLNEMHWFKDMAPGKCPIMTTRIRSACKNYVIHRHGRDHERDIAFRNWFPYQWLVYAFENGTVWFEIPPYVSLEYVDSLACRCLIWCMTTGFIGVVSPEGPDFKTTVTSTVLWAIWVFFRLITRKIKFTTTCYFCEWNPLVNGDFPPRVSNVKSVSFSWRQLCYSGRGSSQLFRFSLYS